MKFPGCEILLRVDRDLTDPDGNVVLSDTRYFLTSQNPDVVRADQLQSQVRNHWQIENCVFHIKDRCWYEDQHWTSRPGVSEWLARLTTLATMALRLLGVGDAKLPIRARGDLVQWCPQIGLGLLGLG